MPQLDKFTFLDQSFCVLFFFLFIYILSLYVFLPKVLFILRFRMRFLNLLKSRYVFFEENLNTKIILVKFLSKKNLLVLHSYLNFLLLQNKDLIRIIRLIYLKG